MNPLDYDRSDPVIRQIEREGINRLTRRSRFCVTSWLLLLALW